MDNLLLAKKSKFFKELDPMDFNAMLRCLNIRIKQFKKDEIIEYQGNLATKGYLVLSGKTRTSFFDEKGNSIPELDYVKDMIFGLEYANSTKPTYYNEEYYAVEESTVLIFDLKKIFSPCENYCKRHRIVINECIKELQQNVSKTKNHIYELAQSKTKDKIFKYLQSVLKKINQEYKLPYNRQEMANYLGVERSALSAELSKLQKEGYIKFNKSTFIKLKELK